MLPGFVCFHSEKQRPVFQEDERSDRRAARTEKTPPAKSPVPPQNGKPHPALPSSTSASGRSILKLDLGRRERMAPNFIVGAITEVTGLPAKNIGKIEVLDDHSLIEMSAKDAAYVLSLLDTCRIKGKSAHFTLLTWDKNAGRNRPPRPEGKKRATQKGQPSSGRPHWKNR